MKKMARKELNSSELSFFCMQIALILKSGMLFTDGISLIYDDIENGNIKDVTKILIDEFSNNVQLYVAMENSRYFPLYVIDMCKIGTTTGKLEEVMISLSEYYDREEYIKSKIRNAVFYPAMLFVMMSFIIVLLVTKIFPIFENMTNELGGEISNQASMVISLSTGIMTGKFIMFFVIFMVIILLGGLIFEKTKKGKKFFYSLFSWFFLTKNIMIKIATYRFASSMSLLLSSGYNVEKSTDILLDIVDNSILKKKIIALNKYMDDGKSFIGSISKLSLFSSMHIQMLNIGQKTGELDMVMKKLTYIYENQADELISNTVALIEPILVGILSIVIGFMLISVMMPLMNIMSSIG